MRRSVILATCLEAIVPTALVFSIYLLMVGHNAPGGGFVGGLVAGASLCVRWLADGRARSGLRIGVPPAGLLGFGLLTSVSVTMAGWLWDLPALTHSSLAVDLPVFGHVKATSALAFDVGVYLIVVGLTLVLLETVGSEEPGAGPRAGEDEGVATR